MSHQWSEDGMHIVRLIDDLCSFMTTLAPDAGTTFDSEFHRRLDKIEEESHACRTNERLALLDYCFQKSSIELDASEIHWRGRHKPFGYAGDFLSIDLTYQRFSESPGRGRLWDEFFHRQDAPQAVCRRKDLFGDIIEEMILSYGFQTLKVLNVASGPGREVLDAFNRNSSFRGILMVDCLDSSVEAIEYSRRLLNEKYSNSVEFHCCNAVLFRPQRNYDFVWSAGLFDYLADHVAISLLRRLWHAVKKNGRLVIGNFADTHRTRPYIEWCGKWFLIHRSQRDLSELAINAGIPPYAISHHVDQWGAIRYLEARRLA